ncbi:FixH family protein [Starkeya sp. ORNL1]|uniref:FixH family protein n=1 Tax=Starkeya sp. ORNL1 TaxID=2709380 RepID=UPI001463E356|nr:FixH family protein [Starkeya sp. ORNL1]QJP14283.1 FixH family protein [Starkeya sp. ORNL1]
MPVPTSPAVSGRPITGRLVLACLVGFFGVIFIANGILVRAALSSFGGVETDSAYQAGLVFKRDEAEAAAQAARHWKVDVHLDAANLDVRAAGPDGTPLAGLDLVARLHHPYDSRLDEEIPVRAVAAGAWRGAPDAVPGQWDLVVELYKDGERQFRSINRIMLK